MYANEKELKGKVKQQIKNHQLVVGLPAYIVISELIGLAPLVGAVRGNRGAGGRCSPTAFDETIQELKRAKEIWR